MRQWNERAAGPPQCYALAARNPPGPFLRGRLSASISTRIRTALRFLFFLFFVSPYIEKTGKQENENSQSARNALPLHSRRASGSILAPGRADV